MSHAPTAPPRNHSMPSKTKRPAKRSGKARCAPAPCWAAIAYRWGWLNEHSYIVRLTTDRQAACDAADAETEHRGGKYGVTVWGADGNAVYHASSSYGEKEAHVNERIHLFERVGLYVVVGLEDGKPLTPEEITERWQHEKRFAEAMARYRQPNTKVTGAGSSPRSV